MAFAADISGVVKDTTGAVVPGAVVMLSGNLHAQRQTRSSVDGSYRFDQVSPGKYTLTASANQLALETPAEIELSDRNLTVALLLFVVRKAENVEVLGSEDKPTVSIDSSNNASAVTIKGEDLKALADNPEDLQSDLQALAGPGAGPGGGAMYIDGFSTGQVPPKQSIQEVHVNQNPFSPEFDKLGLGRIEIITKPGSQNWHGSIGFNFADDVWNARNPYAASKAPLRLVESENILEGPLGKRASFSLDVERHSVDNGSVVNAVILDANSLQPQSFTAVPTSYQRRLLITPRVDIQVSDRQTLSIRYNNTTSNVRQFGIGQFDLSSRSYRLKNRFDTVQVSDNYVGGAWINQLRYQLYRWDRETRPDSEGATTQVLGAFTSGAAQVGRSGDVQTNHEFQDYLSLSKGAHTWRFGIRLREVFDDSTSLASFNGTYTFSSLNAYRITQQGLRAGLPASAIRAMGGGASQFTITSGLPALSAHQFDGALFAGDSWRLRSNLSLDFGLRYEYQTNLQDNANFAPRAGLAWSPFPSAHKKTVVRAGFGIFYDRFALANIVTARRYDGATQSQYVLMDPDSYPQIPTASILAALGTPRILQRMASDLSAPYTLQSVVTVEQQISKDATLAVSYLGTRGVHMLRSIDTNAPLPGSNQYPLGSPSPVYLMTTSGVFNQNQLSINASYKPSAKISFSGYYVLGRANSNTDGLTTYPANPYNFAGEYGPAATDIRHRVLLSGTVNPRWGIRFSPYIQIQSGPPFNITTGEDFYQTALFNARPGISPNSGAGLIATPYGFLNPNPGPNDVILSRNAGRGPGSLSVNLRVNKTFAFGRGRSGVVGGKASEPRYGLTIGVSGRNLTNHNNPGPIIGTLTSPLFGQANQLAGGPNAEGFSESASNRRFELQVRFTF